MTAPGHQFKRSPTLYRVNAKPWMDALNPAPERGFLAHFPRENSCPRYENPSVELNPSSIALHTAPINGGR